MNHIELFSILGPEWQKLDTFYFKGVPHWIGCRVVPLIGFSSSTAAFRGPKDKPKMKFPLYRKKLMPQVNHHQGVYMVTLEAILLVIKNARKCWKLRVLLKEHGYKI
jgi:hypothetical protein